MKVLLIIQELLKVALVAFYWVFPIYLQRVSSDGRDLWFFIVSFLLTCATFSHYEALAEIQFHENTTPGNDAENRPVRVEDLYPKNNERKS